jgi:hypothetical protein
MTRFTAFPALFFALFLVRSSSLLFSGKLPYASVALRMPESISTAACQRSTWAICALMASRVHAGAEARNAT